MNIKEYRKMKNLTQSELAKELKDIAPGIDAPMISKIEKGIVLPPVAVQVYVDAFELETERKLEDLSDLERLILTLLLFRSHEDPLTRQELAVITSKPDRAVRDMISDMRSRGIRICSSSGKSGYWLARTPEDYFELRCEYISRIQSLAKTLKAMDEYTEGQVRLNG